MINNGCRQFVVEQILFIRATCSRRDRHGESLS